MPQNVGFALYLVQRFRIGTVLLFLLCTPMAAIFVLCTWWLTQQLERLVRLFGPDVTAHPGLAGTATPRLPRFIGASVAAPVEKCLLRIIGRTGRNAFTFMEPQESADASGATRRLHGKPLPNKPKDDAEAAAPTP